jgi:hypothetical protein
MENTKNKKDYTNGKVYCIRNNLDDRVYIGSTCQTLAQRMTQHRKNMKDIKKNNTKLYKAMLELGKEAFYIELIEECGCENQQQLRRREGEYIRSYQSGLNQIIAGRTKAELNKENRSIIRQREVEYERRTRDMIRERKQKYYQDNKERISEREKKYREDNRERINARKNELNRLKRENKKSIEILKNI